MAERTVTIIISSMQLATTKREALINTIDLLALVASYIDICHYN